MFEHQEEVTKIELLFAELGGCTDSARVGVLSNDLAEALAQLPPPAGLGELRSLFASANELAVCAALFIAQELRARELLPEVRGLAVHKSASVRKEAVDAIRDLAASTDMDALVTLVKRIEDEAELVRSAVIHALVRMDSVRLKALGAALPDRRRLRLAWLADVSTASTEEIMNRLRCDDYEERAVALAAAMRIADDNDAPLRLARSTYNDELGRWARSFRYGDRISEATISRVHSVRLRVWSPMLDPEWVTQQTRCSPTRSWRKGDARSDSRRLRQGGAWELEVSGEGTQLERIAGELHRKCNGKIAELAKVANVTVVVRMLPIIEGEASLLLGARALATLSPADVVVEFLGDNDP